jgi:hypothetical protein
MGTRGERFAIILVLEGNTNRGNYTAKKSRGKANFSEKIV